MRRLQVLLVLLVVLARLEEARFLRRLVDEEGVVQVRARVVLGDHVLGLDADHQHLVRVPGRPVVGAGLVALTDLRVRQLLGVVALAVL